MTPDAPVLVSARRRSRRSAARGWAATSALVAGALVAAGTVSAAGAAGVSHNTTSSRPTSSRSTSGRGAITNVTHGTADVAYAGSLEYLSEKVIGPAFTAATGNAYQGRGAGADALSQEIRSGEITPNVFESIGSAPITALEPKFTHWYVQFAASPLVVAYNPRSPYAPELARVAAGKLPLRDLFAILARPGFTLGRTDPNLDPQGAAFVEMVELAQHQYHLAAGTVHAVLGSGALGGSSSPEIFDETALEPRLQAGQLDAASAYLSQAVQLHLPYVRLPAAIDLGDPADAHLYATASVRLADHTTVHGAPIVVDVTTIGTNDGAAADAFVAFVLSPRGRALYRAAGYTLLQSTVVGRRADVPPSVLDAIRA